MAARALAIAPGSVRCRQSGLVLILLTLGLLLAASAGIFVLATGLQPSRDDARVSEVQRMEQVRQALLGYAADQSSHPGALPCPDQDGDGASQGSACNTDTVQLGRVPYRTLGLPRESHDLWLAVSPDVHNNGTRAINPGDNAELQLSSAEVEDGYAAVILAPGPPLEGQEERAPGSLEEAQYLEGVNADSDSLEFTDCRGVADCNDRALGLSLDELFVGAQKRLLREIAELLATHDEFPRAAPFAPESSEDAGVCDPDRFLGRLPLREPPADEEDGCHEDEFLDIEGLPQWVIENEWIAYDGDEYDSDHAGYVVYHVDQFCTRAGDPEDCGATGLSIDGTEFELVLAGAGRQLDGQNRLEAETDIDDFVEAPNDDADGAYVQESVRPGMRNDVWQGAPSP